MIAVNDVGRAARVSRRHTPTCDAEHAGGVAGLFTILASDTRLRLLHALARADEVRVCDLAAEIGMRAQGVSNQVRRLVDRGILATRRDGTSVYYRIVDPCVPRMLEFAMCLLGLSADCSQP